LKKLHLPAQSGKPDDLLDNDDPAKDRAQDKHEHDGLNDRIGMAEEVDYGEA
jgi:hypothetical protein